MRARIGIISPDDGINDDEFWNYLPERVNLLFTRYRTDQRFEAISSDMVSSYADLEILQDAAETLRITRPSAVVFGCNSCSFVRGVGHDYRIIEAIQEKASAPATTITTAQVEALRHLGISRVAVGGPYPQELVERLATFLRDSGFEVTSTAGLGMESEWEIGNARPETWANLAREVDRPQAEAILLACSGIRTSPILDSLEQETDKPIISAPAAAVWYALRLAGIETRVPGLGRLFNGD